MESKLKPEFEYYIANQAELVQKYSGKFIVIKDQAVLGVYDNQIAAVVETQKTHPLGTFLVQQVLPGTASYTQNFHSRAIFSN